METRGILLRPGRHVNTDREATGMSQGTSKTRDGATSRWGLGHQSFNVSRSASSFTAETREFSPGTGRPADQKVKIREEVSVALRAAGFSSIERHLPPHEFHVSEAETQEPDGDNPPYSDCGYEDAVTVHSPYPRVCSSGAFQDAILRGSGRWHQHRAALIASSSFDRQSRLTTTEPTEENLKHGWRLCSRRSSFCDAPLEPFNADKPAFRLLGRSGRSSFAVDSSRLVVGPLPSVNRVGLSFERQPHLWLGFFHERKWGNR